MSRTLTATSPAIPEHLGIPALEPVRLSGREGVNSLFAYDLILKTPDALNSSASQAANYNLDDSIGREISCSIQLDGKGEYILGTVEDQQGRKDERGEGFELRTDGHGAIRAKDGLLITTEQRQQARAHIKDMGETSQRLSARREQHESLSNAAQQAQAHGAGDQDEVARALREQNQAIEGRGQGDKPFPELAEPHLVLSSPAGIESSTAGSTHIASDEHTAITSGAHASISAGGSLLASVRQAIRLFAHEAGARLIAYGGDIDIKALKQNIHVVAKMNITHQANRITIAARQEVLINGGGSYMRWSRGGIESGTNGGWVEYAASHSSMGPASLQPAITQFAQTMELLEHPEELHVIDLLSGTSVANRKATLNPGVGEIRIQITSGKITMNALRHRMISPWNKRR